MTQWQEYVNFQPWKKESRELMDVIRERLSKIDETDESWYPRGRRLLTELMRNLIILLNTSPRVFEKLEKLSDAIEETFLSEIPPKVTTNYLQELIHNFALKSELVDPLTVFYEPIFDVDFPDIFRSILSNLLSKLEEDDLDVIRTATERMRDLAISIPYTNTR